MALSVPCHDQHLSEDRNGELCRNHTLLWTPNSPRTLSVFRRCDFRSICRVSVEHLAQIA